MPKKRQSLKEKNWCPFKTAYLKSTAYTNADIAKGVHKLVWESKIKTSHLSTFHYHLGLGCVNLICSNIFTNNFDIEVVILLFFIWDVNNFVVSIIRDNKKYREISGGFSAGWAKTGMAIFRDPESGNGYK